RELLINRSGPLPGDTTHSIKLFGAKDFVFGAVHDVLTGLALRAHSGEPTSRIGGSAVLPYVDQVFITPRGSEERLPWVASIDLKLGYGYRLDANKSVQATMDIYNLFNFQAATAVDQRYTASPVQPSTNGAAIANGDGTPFSGVVNANYGKPTQYQPPRTFRFGLKTTF
ncbi:MAG TPA: TonB-dependent receptor, partial [Polyangiaceae bacterium]